MSEEMQAAKRILIVEDEQYIRELYVEILEDAGFYVESAADGEGGYKKIFAGGYDVVLLDLMLPKMDGLTILRKINKETPPITPNGMIIVLSNIGQEATIAKAIEYGARGYLIKTDYTPDQVIKKIKELLGIEIPA